jgi:hypothetical protein
VVASDDPCVNVTVAEGEDDANAALEKKGFEPIDWNRIEKEAKEAKGFYARKFLTPDELERIAAPAVTTEVPDQFEAQQELQEEVQVTPAVADAVLPALELKNPEMLSMPTEVRPQVAPMGVGLEVGTVAHGKEQWIAPGETPRRSEFVIPQSELTAQEAQQAFNEEVRKRKALLNSLMLAQAPVKRSRVIDLKKRSLGTTTGYSDALMARANRTYFEDEEAAQAYARVAERRPVEVGRQRGRVVVRRTDPEFDKPKQFPTMVRPSYVVEEEVLL